MTEITTVEAKRRILQAQPGKQHHYHNDSVGVIDGHFLEYMAKQHPEVRFDQLDAYARGQALAMSATDKTA